MLWSILLVVAAVGSVRGDAEVMSHVTAHFGTALEECREEVIFFYLFNTTELNLLYIINR